MKLVEKLPLCLRRRKWSLAALGNTEGTITAGGKTIPLARDSEATKLGSCVDKPRFECVKGSFGDSLDDFLFCYTEINPEKENFELSAVFNVQEASKAISWQSGYGIVAVDTVACGSGQLRYRNHLCVGRFRTRSTMKQSAGVRVVAGYRDVNASEVCGERILDLSRDASFPTQGSKIKAGERYHFTLKKNNDGFIGIIRFQGEEQTFSIPGCDFLMRQDRKKLYVGFAVAGAMALEVSEIRFRLSPGTISVTPDGTIRMALPDYPFARELIPETVSNNRALPGLELFISPKGKPDGDGSRARPLDLQTALLSARPGQTIWLMDGIYSPETPYYVPKIQDSGAVQRTTIQAEHYGKAILDGSKLIETVPLFILRGSSWHIKDLVFRNSPLSGLLVCGSHNLIDHCEARRNHDTGILICTYPGTGREEWPRNNHVICCDSHHNCDSAEENADGFGAKLSVGEGNIFFECSAHHNVDDGFDLFSKNVLGPIGAVMLENCIAYENGRLAGAETSGKTGGMGFKLGGDNLAIMHRVKNCIAFLNREAGFSSNNNPYLQLEDTTAWHNGSNPMRHNYYLFKRRTDIKPDWRLSGFLPKGSSGPLEAGKPASPVDAAEAELFQEQEMQALFVSTDVTIPITRDENDLIDLHGLFVLKDKLLEADHDQTEGPGAKLDAKHLKERLQRKKALSL